MRAFPLCACFLDDDGSDCFWHDDVAGSIFPFEEL